jgi:gamma-glutamyltranspeptidase / glutathione hydrolase
MAVSPFSWELPYPSRRQPVLAGNVVATSQPLAAQAGLGMLARGGNAVDAAVATAIALTVVEPTSNGIGGDLFALVWDGRRLHGLNASGRAPAATDVERLCRLDQMPLRGWDPVTVPGAVSGWVALSQRFGRLDLPDLFSPAIAYARDGFPVSPVTAAVWAQAPAAYAELPEFAAAFLPGGRAPGPGERFVQPDQAATLRSIADTAGETFYRGELAERIDAHARAGGAALRAEDLAGHRPEWVAPLELDYAGATVCELPPNGQGIAALQALGILEASGGERLHHEIEAMKLAFADAHAEVADPDWMRVEPAALLDRAYLAERAARIGPTASDHEPGVRRGGGTVYLACGDADGWMVSLIQSNFYGFGSGIVVPGTGIALHDRGAGFSTDPNHPNAVGPGKRPFHTIIPGFLRAGDRPLAAFGVMGGPMQPQGHLQVLRRVLMHGENPQAAVDAPRWRVDPDGSVAVEPGLPAAALDDLEHRGHVLRTETGMGGFGGAQVVWRLASGDYLGASEPRNDGQAAGF